MKKTITILTTFLLSVTLNAQTTFQQEFELDYTRSFGGLGIDLAADMSVDGEGNQYLLGRYAGDFNSGSNNPNVPAVSDNAMGSYRLFLQKVGTDNLIQWTKLVTTVNSNTNVSPGKIAFDSDNNAYVFFSGRRNEVIIDPNGDSINIQVTDSPATTPNDLFLWKITPDGSTAWVKTFGGDYTDYARSITVDENDDLIIVGTFRFTANFQPDLGPHIPNVGSGGFLMTSGDFSSAGFNGFVVKLDSDGQTIWAQNIEGNGIDEVTDVATGNGNIFITGWTWSSNFQFPNVSGTHASINRDGFAGILSSGGQGLGVQYFSGSGNDGCYEVVVDEDANSYVAVNTESSQLTFGGATHTLNYGLSEALIVKFDDIGSYLWHHPIMSDGNDRIADLTIGLDQSLYVTGRIESISNPQGGATYGTLAAAGSHDMYVANISSDGVVNRFSITGGPGIEEIEDIEFHSNGTMYLYGTAEENVPFTLWGTDTIDLAVNGADRDIFIARGWDCNADITPEVSLIGDSLISDIQIGAGFEWIFDDGNTITTYPSSGEPILVNPTDSGAYALIISYYGCPSDTSNFVVFDANTGGNVGLNELNNIQISVYPNPSNGIITVDGNILINRLEIVDITGKTVAHSSSNKADLSSLQTGSYFVKVYHNNTTSVKKIIKK